MITLRSLSRPARLALPLLLAAGLAACSGDSEAQAPASGSAAPQVSKALRDVRYCEVIPSVRDKATIVTTVYNTLGLNDCPADAWATLTEEGVMEQYGADAVKLNGPRHWMMDEIIGSGSTTDSPVFTFGADPGIAMQQRAVIETKVNESTVGDQLYVPNEVQRDTVFAYDAGQPVFELTDPDGHVYMMQSYSQIVDPSLSYDQLAGLGSRLQLPAGWSFSTRTLDERVELSTAATNGTAYVINDDLLNSYQRVS